MTGQRDDVERLAADLPPKQPARGDKVAELEDLVRRQALFITKLVMESRGHSFAAEVTHLRAALVRMIWRSIADDAECTCTSNDVCPECEAMQALGVGRWTSARRAEVMQLPRVAR